MGWGGMEWDGRRWRSERRRTHRRGATCCNTACCISVQRPVQLCEDALARSGVADGIDERVRMVERSLEAARSGAESSMAAAAACRAEGARLAEHVMELGRKIEPLRHVAAELPVVRLRASCAYLRPLAPALR